jgi:hypothetical protein
MPKEILLKSMQCKNCRTLLLPALEIEGQLSPKRHWLDLPHITLVLPPDVRLIDKLAERAVHDWSNS